MAKTPHAPPADLEAEIRCLIDEARSKWGETFELKLLQDNWGDTLDDAEMLEAIRRLNTTGRYLPRRPLALIDPRDPGNTLYGDQQRKKPAAP